MLISFWVKNWTETSVHVQVILRFIWSIFSSIISMIFWLSVGSNFLAKKTAFLLRAATFPASSSRRTLGEHPHQSTRCLYWHLQPCFRRQLTNRRLLSTTNVQKPELRRTCIYRTLLKGLYSGSFDSNDLSWKPEFINIQNREHDIYFRQKVENPNDNLQQILNIQNRYKIVIIFTVWK